MAYDPHRNDDENPYEDLLKKERPGAVQTSAPQLTVQPLSIGFNASAPPPPASHAQGRSATGWTNYDQLYSANEDAAKHTAGQLAGQAEKSAQGAQGALGKAQAGFGQQVQQGTLTGPTQRDYGHATGQVPFFTPPSQMPQAAQGAAQAVATQRGDAEPHIHDLTEGEWRADLQANAGKGYTGPSALSALDEYGGLSGQVDNASQQVGALGSQGGLQSMLGQSHNAQLDAMLVGSAGRPRFHDVQGQYGDLRGELERANEASQSQADAARATSVQGADDYHHLLSDYDAKKAAEAAYAAAHQTAPVTVVGPGGVATLGTAANPSFGDNLSSFPSDENEQRATDQLNPDNYGQKWHDSQYMMGLYKEFSGTSNDNAIQGMPGSSWEEKFHNWLTSQVGEITPAEWSALESMTPEQRKAWFDDKKAKKGGG